MMWPEGRTNCFSILPVLLIITTRDHTFQPDFTVIFWFFEMFSLVSMLSLKKLELGKSLAFPCLSL